MTATQGGDVIGKRLRRLRLQHGLTQRELASPRYTNAYVSTIEAGRRHPSPRAIEYFAKKLGVSVGELATGRPADLEATLELRVHEARIALSAGRAEDAEIALTEAERAARRYELPAIEAKVEESRGLMGERSGDPEGALRHYQRAEDLLANESPAAQADAVDGKARCFTALGDVRYAIHTLESLLGELQRAGLEDPNALARIHAGLVYSYVDAGLYAKAAESAAELDRLAPGITDPIRVAQMHLHVAQLHLVQGKVREALRSLQRCEDAYRQADLKVETGYAQLARGYVLSREGKLAQAQKHLERARAIFEETADRKDLTRTLNELARVARLQGNTERAAELLERSILLIAETDVPILAWAHRELGSALSAQDALRAEKNVRMAIELYERSDQPVELALSYGLLGDLLTSRGESDAGCEAYRTGIQSLSTQL
jgi:tetratricopeptide (TPR) repeat protein